MTGFEVVVRPVVFPNIRPAPPRVLPPESDPLQGLVTLTGGGLETANASYSFSVSVTRQNANQESKRQYDTERVYQVDSAGNINRSTYIDVDRLKKVRLETGAGPLKVIYADPEKKDNVETIAADQVTGSTPKG
jgi:hypothetical protein